MQLDSIKATVTALWVSAVCTVGIAGDLRSLSGWTVVAGLAILPPLVMMWRWNAHRPTVGIEKVVFDLAVAERPTEVASGKYGSLYRYLENRYADVTVLTFGQIEDLLGFALPPLARTSLEWWTLGRTNVPGSVHSNAWTLAGRTATVNLQAATVAFKRIA